MRALALLSLSGALSCALSCAASFAKAASAKNAIERENEKPVDRRKDSWLPETDPVTFEAKHIGINGKIDGYPSEWSYKQGDALALKVSTRAKAFRTRVYRLGWYPVSPTGPVGSRLVAEVPSTRGQRWPMPPENTQTGLAEPNWPDCVSIPIGADWTPGQYVVRFTTIDPASGKDLLDGPDGGEAFTHFAVRDDGIAPRAPILYVDSLLTEAAYDPWPKLVDERGVQLYGKSTYSYNSAGADVQASGAKQAVEVSLGRPRGENWGLSIFRDWTVPTVQFLEKHGLDVAYATSVDLHDGRVLAGRKVWMDSGHDEYWTSEMWDHLEEARNLGLSLAFFSGNDLSWQVRLEKGASGRNDRMVAYKIAAYPDSGRCGTCWEWGGDPEFQAALAARRRGDVDGQLAHLRRVTYAFAGLKDWDPDAPSPIFGKDQKGAALQAPTRITRLAIGLEGLMNGPKLPAGCPAADDRSVCRGIDWIVDHAEHWLYVGTGLANGDRLPMVVGYEMDNARLGKEYPTRPPTQIILAHSDAKFTPEGGSALDFEGEFNAQAYAHPSGARVFSAGTINWFWGVERDDLGAWGGLDLERAVKPGVTLDQAVTRMTLNVFAELAKAPGVPQDFVPGGAAKTTPPAAQPTASDGSCGCSTPGRAARSASWLALLAGLSALAGRARRRGPRAR